MNDVEMEIGVGIAGVRSGFGFQSKFCVAIVSGSRGRAGTRKTGA
jgi:hypothetical protein